MPTRTVGDAFLEFLSRLTPTSAERSAATNHRTSVESAVRDSFDLIAFRQTGSFRHGTGVRGFADVDLLAQLGFLTQPSSSYEALTAMERVMNLRFPTTPVRISRPAVVLDFARGLERWEVIPGYTTGVDGVFEIPSPELGGGWIRTAPDAHFSYVDRVNNRSPIAGGAKALTRLLKAWKYYNGVPISSIYLEMIATRFIATQASFIPIFDVHSVLMHMYYDGVDDIDDPSEVGDPISACSSAADLTKTSNELLSAHVRAKLAKEAYVDSNETYAFSYLNQLFSGKFPSRQY